MRTISIVLGSVLLGITARPALAQGWGLAAEIGQASFSGHARSVGGEPETTGHPSRSGTWGLRIDRSSGRVRFSVGVMAASTGVEFESDEASAEVKDLLNLLEVSPEVSVVILRRQAALRLHAGAMVDRWSPEGDESRTSVGAHGALSLEMPFSSRVGIQVRWQAAITSSLFDEDDLPIEFERKQGRNQRWILGVRLGL